ncbi:MAG: hypothetical protein Tsb006_5300 [Rickettsiaceae bacterium]
MTFKGTLTALITPFKEGKIDFHSLEKIIKQQVEARVDGVVIGGSTGEGSSLSEEEHYSIVSFASKCANRQIQVIAGITGISTLSTCEKVSLLSKFLIFKVSCP